MTEEFALTRLIPLVFLLSGIGLLIAAARYVRRTRAFLSRAAEATGEVVALEKEPATGTGDLCTYRPVVSFQSRSGQRTQFAALAHSNPPEYQVGDPVRVLYDPERPQEACIRSFTQLWLLAVLLGGLGLIFTALGAGLLLAG